MSSLFKNLLLGLTVVCIITVIVFCVQLIVINSGVDRASPGSVSGGPGQSGNENNDDPPDGEDGDNEGSDATPVSTPRPPPQGTRHQLIISDNNILLIYAREEYFNYEEGDLKWLFNYTGGGRAGLEIVFTMIPPSQGGDVNAESFLNRYSGGTEATFTREEIIQGSAIYGYHAIDRHGTETFEVWIHDFVGSDIALAFVIRYENEQQRDALYEVLSSLDIIRIGDMITPPPGHGLDGDGTGLGIGDGTDLNGDNGGDE